MKKTYKIFTEYWDRLVVDVIETDDIYHEIGKIYCETLEKINRIDYKELKSINDCPVYKPCCEVCLKQCKRYSESKKEKNDEKDEN